ncbi:ATP-dependent helicase/nuclease subunit A [Aquabacterium commune]|uniref:DNA 3'-5' helicase n=1 Tax=Aquabacterium commune TaxID=70586 RepID=A0A4R6RFA2_9BURK|nr:UvrD-helicase domain-containing protein [Aquabacterium commune]TDP84467.1 ATP-dependent helicase/nuclease subunit A [Aquabacterium commune]
MAHEAYQLDGQWVDPARFYAVACDPQRSVVVEACAGAGKTWMLVSRILRAMLDGVPPQQVLAITFTRKAAGEMRERLHRWLADFAQASPAQRETELRLRGVPEARLAELSPRLGALHGEWLAGGRGVEIHTIHGWFSRLVKAAPLDLLAELNLPPELQLLEDTEAIWPELWARCLRRIDALAGGRQPEASAPKQDGSQGASLDDPLDDAWLAFHAVIRAAGRHNAQAWLLQALHNRLEVFLAEQGGVLADSVPSAADWDAQWAGLDHPHQALARTSVNDGFWALARAQATAKPGSKAVKAGEAVALALAETDLAQRMDALLQALFTKDGKGDARKQLGDAPELAWAQAWLHDLRQACAQQDAHALHRQMVTLSRLMMDEYAAFKRERGLADMADLELAAARLLSDEALAGWVQQRLDSQVRQVLMDEFQDTSPLQWQALRAWLSAYAGAGGGGSGREPLQVFLVGDPKQSIYRFRRADPRVFEAAKDFVIEGLGGHLLACDHTRRNAPGVLDCLNRVMGQAHAEGAFPGWRTHTTTSQDAARIRVLPSVSKDSADSTGVNGADDGQADDTGESSTPWRDTLRTPRLQARTTVKAVEAAQLAQAVAHAVRHEGVPADEVFVLSRTRATLALVAEALDALGVPHVAPDNTPLIDTPEVRDLVAVVEALVSPRQNLALAHALKSPVFGVDDAGLMALAAWATKPQASTPWWDALQAWAASGEAMPEALARAAHLLSAWRGLAAQLPPHDLLTRIVTQGEVRERVLACVPTSQRAQALWHIDALLAHTLEMDAGRDATPYRWIRALRQQSPTLPARAQAGAVQLLTIHGAKGLEAQVVFMLDTDPLPPKRASYALLVDWPDNAPHPARVAFVQAESAPPPSLAAPLEAERLAAQREELNALYVALTRAREQLVFSRSVPSRASSSGAMSWWQRLVASEAIDPQGEAMAGQGNAPGLQTPRAAMAELAVLPALRPKPADDNLAADAEADDPHTRLLGQAVHRALEVLTVQPVSARSEALVRQAVVSALRSVGLPTRWQGDAEARTRAILFAPELQPWLDPQRLLWAGNEVALCHEGQTLRLDRLVARQTDAGREWWVIDYKLNAQPDALLSHRQQLRRYIAAVSHLQPGEPVRAAFVSGKGQWLPVDALG